MLDADDAGQPLRVSAFNGQFRCYVHRAVAKRRMNVHVGSSVYACRADGPLLNVKGVSIKSQHVIGVGRFCECGAGEIGYTMMRRCILAIVVMSAHRQEDIALLVGIEDIRGVCGHVRIIRAIHRGMDWRVLKHNDRL